jgi:hypothetical protein
LRIGRNDIPRIWRLSVPSGVLGEDANRAVWRNLHATNLEPALLGGFDGFHHVVFAEQARPARRIFLRTPFCSL